jgi:hypothetical protein
MTQEINTEQKVRRIQVGKTNVFHTKTGNLIFFGANEDPQVAFETCIKSFEGKKEE